MAAALAWCGAAITVAGATASSAQKCSGRIRVRATLMQRDRDDPMFMVRAPWKGAQSGHRIGFEACILSPHLPVEVRIKDANLGDPRDRQFVTGRCAADGRRRGPVVDAERMLAIGCDVGMDPGNAVLGVLVDDLTAETRAVVILRDAKAVRKVSFD